MPRLKLQKCGWCTRQEKERQKCLYMVEKKPEFTKYLLDVVLMLGPIIPIILLFSESRKQLSLSSIWEIHFQAKQ